MNCSACANTIKRLVEKEPGVRIADVSFDERQARPLRSEVRRDAPPRRGDPKARLSSRRTQLDMLAPPRFPISARPHTHGDYGGLSTASTSPFALWAENRRRGQVAGRFAPGSAACIVRFAPASSRRRSDVYRASTGSL
ncbi:heavy-metal-associated domain-containing protein [Bradyrhizobium campsiandrae]|uniref:heavy-metal-associated domain-containing protein n=1 Tax=Bradyrhizobium campsiandrae TaxID=1729892 RepID=UPI001FD119BA|nr:heavy metal-associated domain-containing protein [Bradyrhizobium campsiandrae]